MAESLNLQQFSSSGIYTLEIDQSSNISLPLSTGRLIIGNSRKGPINSIVFIPDLRTRNFVFGDKDPYLENRGCFFHRAIEVALREGPVFAMNVGPIDDTLDKAYFSTFNTEVATGNTSIVPLQDGYSKFFNTQKLWFASDKQLTRVKNLSDDLEGTPEVNKILSFANLGKKPVTIFTQKAQVLGYDVTIQEWFGSLAEQIPVPSFAHPRDYVSDFFIDVIVVEGLYTDYLALSKDPVYGKYFSAQGLRKSLINEFLQLKEVKVVSRTQGCMIPDFKDRGGRIIDIARLINNQFATTEVLCAIDTEKTEVMDLTQDTFIDLEEESHRIDLLGHGYFELTNSADDFDTKLIDVISYKKPASKNLYYIDDANGTNVAPGVINTNTIYVAGTPKIIRAYEGTPLYKAYFNGFLKDGDINTDNLITPTIRYSRFEGPFVDTGNGNIKYITIKAYDDITLLNQNDILTYTSGPDTVIEFTAAQTEFSHDFEISSQVGPTEIVIVKKVMQGNTTISDDSTNTAEFLKPGQFLRASVSEGRPRITRILSVRETKTDSGSPTTTTTYLTVKTADEILVSGSPLMVTAIKGVDNFVTELKGQGLKQFTLDINRHLANGTNQNTILNYLFDSTNIPVTIAEREIIDVRYLIDCWSGDISSASKTPLINLAAMHKRMIAFVNAPSFDQFEKSNDPSFIDATTGLVSAQYISEGGDLTLNPSFTFTLVDDQIDGINTGTFAAYCMPWLVIRESGINKIIPPAMYIANLFMRKFTSGNPFAAVAAKRGIIGDSEVVGLEYELTRSDKDYLEPKGFNLITRKRGFGIMLMSNNTAYQKIQSALNNLHVRDSLITIENDIERILFNFLFDFNDEITRLRIRTIVENYLESVRAAGGINTYEVIMDTTNNTSEVIEQNTGIIDIKIDFPRAMSKLISRITITRVNGQLSAESTGFVASF